MTTFAYWKFDKFQSQIFSNSNNLCKSVGSLIIFEKKYQKQDEINQTGHYVFKRQPNQVTTLAIDNLSNGQFRKIQAENRTYHH